MTIVTAPKKSLMVSPTTASRCWASPLRVSGGTDWLSARSMSSRSGAVYCTPVRPVRSSVDSAAVSRHRRPTWPAICAVMSSPNRPRAVAGLASVPRGCGGSVCAAASAISAGSGRGTAKPA
ncbi:hypothetical protein LAUMK191_05531 [Mycobacterium attenuatum]|uniref:Uncharacterized protein n=1 Tax=Mycobacterium attenuatum TaxID=2341086 RepID=A0A498QL44_9MYCO|nr:hypothetical protein LAUMK136_05559 [Mycobacterium attenuatum]VBA60451.1 hypothetical protein LAUMK191_05531 [Mycobacterium attenuatum]